MASPASRSELQLFDLFGSTCVNLSNSFSFASLVLSESGGCRPLECLESPLALPSSFCSPVSAEPLSNLKLLFFLSRYATSSLFMLFLPIYLN